MKQIDLNDVKMGDHISFNLWTGIATDKSTITDVEYLGRVAGSVVPDNGIINKATIHAAILQNITSLPDLSDIGDVNSYEYIVVKSDAGVTYYGVPWINGQTIYNLGVETMTITLPNNRLSEDLIRSMFLIHNVSDLTIDVTV